MYEWVIVGVYSVCSVQCMYVYIHEHEIIDFRSLLVWWGILQSRMHTELNNQAIKHNTCYSLNLRSFYQQRFASVVKYCVVILATKQCIVVLNAWQPMHIVVFITLLYQMCSWLYFYLLLFWLLFSAWPSVSCIISGGKTIQCMLLHRSLDVFTLCCSSVCN